MATLYVQPRTAIKVGHFTPGTPEWFEARQSRLGGSEISAVIGRSPFESHLSLWLRKQGLAPAKDQDALMEWGNRLEPAVLAKFAEERDGWYDLGKAGSFVHVDRPWQLASPDGLHKSGKKLVEAKTAQNDLEWGEPPDGEVPVYYRCQALWNMSVMGARELWMPVLIRGCMYREYLIEWDSQAEEEIAFLLDQGAAFIESLALGEPPPIDGHDETLSIVRAAHPEIEPGDVAIMAELRQAYLDAVIAERTIKEAKQEAAAKILVTLGRLRNATDERGERFAFRKPNGEHPPYLCADDRLVKSLRGSRPILGGGG